MRILSAEFVTSARSADQYPEPLFPEIAFGGRSNAGKSSLINTLLGKKDLVKTSAKPGCTRMINFFRINGTFFFVDLPGFGYAKVSMAERRQWGPMVKKYLAVRKPLKALVLIMDIRRGPEIEEINLLSYLNSISLHSIPVLTKADKFSRSGQLRQTHRIVRDLPEALFKTEFVLFSSKTRQGKDALWERIAEVLPEVCR